MSSSQLARHTFVSAQAMDGIVRALEASGLIERRRDASNRRRLLITLTPAALSLLAECRVDVDRIEDQAFAALDAAERLQLSAWLAQSRRAWSTGRLTQAPSERTAERWRTLSAPVTNLQDS